MNTERHFIEPLDMLFLRGNKLFGDPGSFGESLVPPWPSVAAGALRSALLVHKDIDPALFAKGKIADSELGTPERPGAFALTAFQLARRHRLDAGDSEHVEPLYAPPADLVVYARSGGAPHIRMLRPRRLHDGIHCSQATPLLAVLAENKRGKPEHGLWLTAAGWERYLAGEAIDPCKHLVSGACLWHVETRVGVGLDPAKRRAADGQLFSAQAVALRKAEHGGDGDRGFDVGFFAETTGARLPKSLTLRLGGDGRGALSRRVKLRVPEPDYNALVRDRRCRLILTAPGIFARGWLPTGITGTGRDLRFDLHGVRGRLTCAAVSRAEVVSGFDVAKGGPKPAQRAAPTGSVYWIECLEATAETLRSLAAHGLWSVPVENAARRAEGFNRITLAAC